MEKYIDVHCHLEGEKFKEDLDLVIARAKEKGVLIIQSGVNPETNRKSLDISKKYGIMCSFGLYPIDAIASEFDDLNDDYMRVVKGFDVDKELEWMREHKDDMIAIGEIGLEFKVIECSPEIKAAQEKVFRKAINLAKEIDKPIVIHSRGGEERVIEIMEEEGCKKVLMHCFMGKKGLIKRAAENGWYFSIPSIVNRLQHFETVLKLVEMDQILTETDTPYLSPVPGERNEPSTVVGSIKKIAEIKELDEEEVREKIISNAKELFGF